MKVWVAKLNESKLNVLIQQKPSVRTIFICDEKIRIPLPYVIYSLHIKYNKNYTYLPYMAFSKEPINYWKYIFKPFINLRMPYLPNIDINGSICFLLAVYPSLQDTIASAIDEIQGSEYRNYSIANIFTHLRTILGLPFRLSSQAGPRHDVEDVLLIYKELAKKDLNFALNNCTRMPRLENKRSFLKGRFKEYDLQNKQHVDKLNTLIIGPNND